MSESTCEKCRTTPGTSHTFHYGKQAGLPVTDPPPVYRRRIYGNMHRTTTEHYEIGGVDAVTLCNRCLTRARMRRAGTMLRHLMGEPLVAFLYLLWVVGVAVWAWRTDWTQLAAWSAFGVLATAIVYLVIYTRLTDEDFAQHTAVELHEDKLRAQGWNAFWTDQDFILLTPH
jgi:hypothetical protein